MKAFKHIFSRAFIILFVMSLTNTSKAQIAPACPNNSIYIHSGSSILKQAVTPINQPASSVLNNMPPGSGGLAVGDNLGFPAPNPTYWTTSGGNFWYYNNGGTWTNTGHSQGPAAAVNLGAGGGYIYNLIGASGQIWRYNGTGPATLLVTIGTFGGGGPYDVVADQQGNFYILKTNGPQWLNVYNSSGVQQCSYSLVNAPLSSAGGGFAIVNGTVYYTNAGSRAGNILNNSSVITFTNQTLQSGGDWASCPLPVPTGSITSPQGGTLTCTVPQIDLVASIIVPQGVLGWSAGNYSISTPPNTPSCSAYNWSGPGIVSGQGTATISVNQPGTYSFTFTGCGVGCPGYSITASYNVVGQGASFFPVINAPTCISSPTQISVSPNSTTNTIIWNGPGIQGPNNTPTITVNAPGIYSVSIGIPNSACMGTATVLISQSPTVSISASTNSMCLYNSNGSLNSVTLTASGASNYTWTGISGLINASPSTTGSTITFSPDVNATIGQVTLLGSNGVCSNGVDFTIAIVPNPTISVTSGSICAGGNITLVASGATSYVWSPSNSLNSSTNASVIATPSANTVYNIIGNSFGCFSQTQTTSVTVAPLPIINIAPLSNTICQGGNISLTANGATNYTWSPGNTLNTTNGPVVIANPMNTTIYTVIGELNTCTASAVYQVSVIVMPSIVISASAYTICQNSSAILTANGASSYTWSPATGLNTTNGSQVIANPATTTTYVVSGGNGQCLAFGTVVIHVVPFPNFQLSTPNPKICFTNSTSIFATGASAYVWTPPTGLSNINGGMATASPMSSTNYTVRGVNTIGDVSCSSAKEIYIEVVPEVQPTISSSVAICKGQSVKLIAGGGNSYAWSPMDGLSDPYIANPLANPKTTIVYSVSISNSGSCAKTATVLVRVNPIPELSAGEDFVSNIDEPMHLNALGNGTLTWVSGEKILCANCPNSQIMPTKTGCYRAESINEFGCKNSDEVCVEVTTNYNIYIPNIFTPNDDGNNDVFLVYGTGLSKFEMLIFDRWGEKLFSSKDQLQGWDGTFKGQLSKNDAYTYQIKYQSLDGKSHTRTGHVTLMK